jgi:ParB family chromosome partitioning protein
MNAQKSARGLGRGLDALLGDAPAAPRTAAGETAPVARRLQSLPIEFLKPNPSQPRKVFNEDAIDELAASLKARGMLQPILVRPMGRDAYEVVAGERRWRAAQKAGLHEVPVVIRELTDAEAAEIALIENIQRVDLSPLEEAAAYERLATAYGRTQDEIAAAVGKSRSHVANMMRLSGLTPRCRAALEAGEISAGHARTLLTAKDPDAALKAVLKDGLNVRALEALVKRMADAPAEEKTREPAKPSVPGRKDADTRALEADLANALGLVVEIEHSPRGSGAITIRYRAIDQLDDVCKRLMGAGV